MKPIQPTYSPALNTWIAKQQDCQDYTPHTYRETECKRGNTVITEIEQCSPDEYSIVTYDYFGDYWSECFATEEQLNEYAEKQHLNIVNKVND